MIRSMSSALSGLRNHQAMIDIVGNNIANVSTVGFKSSTAVFSDVLSQTLNGAGRPSATTGGTNPSQIGLGSKLAGTVQSFQQGAIQRTGRSTDMAIQGDGFFIVRTAGGENLFTRAGSFNLDATGRLTSTDGMPLQGWMADANGLIDTNLGMGPLEVQVGDLLPPSQTGTVNVGGNLSADEPVGAIAVISFDAYDTQGATTQIDLTFTKSAANEWTVTGQQGTPPVAVPLVDNVLTFDAAGELTAPAGRAITITGGTLPGIPSDLTIDLGSAASPGRLTQYSGTTTTSVTNQDGSGPGTLLAFNVSPDGIINGNYSNGLSRPIGQVAMAVFTNPGGLERVSGAWRATPNSGLAQIGIAGSGGRGLLSANSLEMSNVDLAEEFTRLIVAQRGFQGNARMITTSDEVLQEVVNLRR